MLRGRGYILCQYLMRGAAMEQLTGSRPTQSGRRPKTKPSGRVCREPECATVLSKYNLRDTCHTHTPVRFPRVRGQIAS